MNRTSKDSSNGSEVYCAGPKVSKKDKKRAQKRKIAQKKLKKEKKVLKKGKCHARSAQKGSLLKKSRIRETPTLSTDADNRTDTNLKRLHDLS